MANKIRHCVVAPEAHQYEYCGHCGQWKSEEMWRNLYCSKNCMEIFDVCSKYTAKKLTAQEAREKLNNLEVPELQDLAPGLRNNIIDILEKTKVVESTIQLDEPLSEDSQSKPRSRGRRRKIVNED